MGRFYFGCTQEKSSIPTGLVWYTNMAAVLLFWNTNMAAVTSCENALLLILIKNNNIHLFLKWPFLCHIHHCSCSSVEELHLVDHPLALPFCSCLADTAFQQKFLFS